MTRLLCTNRQGRERYCEGEPMTAVGKSTVEKNRYCLHVLNRDNASASPSLHVIHSIIVLLCTEEQIPP